ncbi:doubled CXXCH motif [bacterium BMS3Abin07]|nr:doubled CXXCH motif [bacterium BMS3Abin07]GBE33444.1 doubled CXXCH motif [bacterium BMS3Bbin05]HDO22327.1 cytochrome C [Nitrospirota bacterium]HDZ88064.1 cytochrome C [Nitrospirota bacterium]
MKRILYPFIVCAILISIPVFSSYGEAGDDLPKFFVPPPPLSKGIFPCSQCHAYMKTNRTRRALTYHTKISKGFNHAREQRWCLDCHNPDDRDKLRLASGKLISFDESEYLCGQCHGTIFRDWKAGEHGKRTGYWNGKKVYRLCVQCHYPHWPKFQKIKPLPPPIKPDNIKYRELPKDKIPLNPLGNIK